MYKLLPYIISKFEDKQVIQNCENTVILKNKEISDFFIMSELESKNDYIYEELESVFKHETEDILKFLLDNKLIVKLHEIDMLYKGVKFISNDDTFINSIEFNSKGVDYDVIIKKIDNFMFDIKPEYLHIIFLNPFNYSTMIKINERLRESNVIYRIAFYYQHRIYISNYHMRDWHNPCPLCFYANLESNLRGKSKVMNTVSFQTMLDLIYSKNPAFELVNKFTCFSIMGLVNVLLEDVKVQCNQQINRNFSIDYNNNIIFSDEAIYWNMCDCYE